MLNKSGEFIGNPLWDQWMGNICMACNRVYCVKCIKWGGPTPCPECGTPTKVAAVSFVQGLVEHESGKAIATAVNDAVDEVSVKGRFVYATWYHELAAVLSKIFGSFSVAGFIIGFIMLVKQFIPSWRDPGPSIVGGLLIFLVVCVAIFGMSVLILRHFRLKATEFQVHKIMTGRKR